MSNVIDMNYEFESKKMGELGIPEYMHDGIVRYIKDRIKPGHFLTAVICNDLFDAVARADDQNVQALSGYVKFFYNYAPSGCWGSKEKMEAWLEGTVA